MQVNVTKIDVISDLTFHIVRKTRLYKRLKLDKFRKKAKKLSALLKSFTEEDGLKTTQPSFINRRGLLL